jgi:hypothetical protein
MPTPIPTPEPSQPSPPLAVQSEREAAARNEVNRLLATLRDPENRLRTGVLLVHTDQIPRLPSIAARFNLDTLDYARRVEEEMPVGSRFVTLTADTEVARLQRLGRESDFASDPVLLVNADVILAKLRADEGPHFWRAFTEHIIRPRHGLLIALPMRATALLPEAETEQRLKSAHRLAVLPASL